MGRNKIISDEELQLRKIFEKKMHLLMSSLQIKNDIDVYRDTTISQERFSNLINQKATPSVLELSQLAQKYKLPLDYFINEDNTSTNINWRDWTYRDIISMLIDMSEEEAIGIGKVRYLDQFIDEASGYPRNYEREQYAIYDRSSEYIELKLHDWYAIYYAISDNEIRAKTLPMFKEAFLSSIKDERFFDNIDRTFPFR